MELEGLLAAVPVEFSMYDGNTGDKVTPLSSSGSKSRNSNKKISQRSDSSGSSNNIDSKSPPTQLVISQEDKQTVVSASLIPSQI